LAEVMPVLRGLDRGSRPRRSSMLARSSRWCRFRGVGRISIWFVPPRFTARCQSPFPSDWCERCRTWSHLGASRFAVPTSVGAEVLDEEFDGSRLATVGTRDPGASVLPKPVSGCNLKMVATDDEEQTPEKVRNLERGRCWVRQTQIGRFPTTRLRHLELLRGRRSS
jgi:hypothetical protein